MEVSGEGPRECHRLGRQGSDSSITQECERSLERSRRMGPDLLKMVV